MVELGGLVAAPILKIVLDHIVSALDGQIILGKNFEKDLKHMKRALESVEAVLDHAGKQSITDKLTCLWLKDLKDAMYAISDMIDEFEEGTEAFTQPSAPKFSLKRHLAVMIRPCLTIGPKFNLANKMKSMRDDLKEITDRHKKFNLLAGSNASELNVPDERETISSIDVQIFGRNEERDRILAYLSEISLTKDCSVLAIYGIGGLGKTTLAQMVYNSSQYTEYSLVWVYVSQAFDLRKIGNSIISQISKIQTSYTETQMVHNNLLELLVGKKILVVLDDLWEVKENDWNKLMAMLLGEGSKVIVIVTTRTEDIAKKVSTNQPHKLALLENEVCWSIIKQKSDFESIPHKEELKDIGMCIARKCGGVALAAQTLGFVLKNEDIHLWRSVMNSDIWSLSDSEDPDFRNVLASLMLSYSVMPKHLKLCFAYCAIFPKGHKIVKSDLIQQWISLDFIKPTILRSCWDIGEACIRQLLGLSFLQDSQSSLAAGVHLEDATLFTMHDLVHDLARSVMFDEIIVPGKDNNNGGSCGRYALHNDCSKQLESPKIRALRFMGCGEIELDGAAFLSVKFLRILDLSDCLIHKLPDSIGVLKQLRYLNAPRIQDTTIPDSITGLSKLTYLNLHGSAAILALPELIGDIEGLLYIDLSGCSGIQELPESLGKLKKLVHLNLSNCSHVGDVSKFLGSLTELRYLNLSYCSNIGKLPGALGRLSQLKYLNLSFSSYIESPQSVMLYLSNLSSLELENLQQAEDLLATEAEKYRSRANDVYRRQALGTFDLEFPQEAEVLGDLTNLEYLNLSCNSSSIEKLPEALGTFAKLKYLNLSGFQHLRALPELFANLKKLVHLDLSNCPRVNDVPKSLSGLTKLQYLNLSIPQQQRMFMIFTGQQSTQLRGLPEVICSLTNLRYLNLSSCMNFIFGYGYDSSSKGQVDGFMYGISTFSNLEHLDLSSNKHIVSIPESLCELRKLHTLDLSHCRDLQMIPESIGTIYSLKFLYLIGCPSLSQLPQLNSTISLPHFAVHPGYGESSSSLLLLQHTNPDVLKISRLENVKSPEEADDISLTEKDKLSNLTLDWTRDAERFVDDKMLLEKLVPPSNLKELDIRGYRSGCFPAWLMDIAYYLPNLVRFELCNLTNCNVLPPLSQLPNLTFLVLRGLESLEEWNTSYSSGEKNVIGILVIDDCPKLKIKPLPPRAKYLNISNSDSVLSSWGEYAGASTTISNPVDTTTLRVGQRKLPMHQWTLLQHLPGLICLKITGCGDLACSPEIIQHLSSLKSLLLEDRDQEELPEWLGELTSLQKLRISGCSGLKELHESMRLLTKLVSLKLDGCSSITSIPHWLGELTSLQKLKIVQCSGLKELHESMRQLTDLQYLKLSGCSSITSLPHWLGELTSLKKLDIWCCDGIRSLPEGIQQLTNLKELNIYSCPSLKKWCDLQEGNEMKLTPNQERACVLPTSLEKLEIDKCDGISSLPEGIQQLTNLQELQIYRSPALKKWCKLEENKAKLVHILDKRIRNHY